MKPARPHRPTSRCSECGQIAGHFSGCPEDVGRDDDPEPDYDAPKPLTPMENSERNDEHSQP